MGCEDIFLVPIFAIFSIKFRKIVQEKSWSPFSPCSTRLVTIGDIGGRGAKIMNFALTSFLNGPVGLSEANVMIENCENVKKNPGGGAFFRKVRFTLNL